jgi:hypothetical protein
MSKRMLVLMCSIFLIVPLLFLGCSGDDGSNGAPGAKGDTGPAGQDLNATATPESCNTCHETAGNQHQAGYDQLYQDNVIQVTGLAYTLDGSNNDVVTFTMKKAKANFDCTKVQNLNIYWAPYDNAVGRFQFDPPAERLAIKGGVKVDNVTTGSLTGDATTGLCTSTFPSQLDNASLLTKNGVIVVYGYDEQVGSIPSPSRVKQVKYPYAQILKTGTVDYVSAANVEGCEKCHTVPYLKHGNIYGRVNGDPATDMYTCKACHLDNGEGGHQVWQLLVDDTERAAELWAIAPGDVESEMTPAELTKYAYKTRLMNDVHMSHAMEFEYPQSMATCNTCHEGKLTAVLTDTNFTLETCKSCHALTGSAASKLWKPQPALADIIPHNFTDNTVCNTCHTAGGTAPAFAAIHSGYDKMIYGVPGTKYSSEIKVTIDNASFADNTGKLTFAFSGTGSLGGLSATGIKPTVLVGLYGYDTKDYIVDPHSRTGADRTLEYVVGATHARFTTDNTTAAGSWKVTADLSTWAAMIADGTIKRAEIAVIPTLRNADNVVVALDAPSRTFDLKANAFKDSFYPAIVKVAAGCNNCHDALATNFHTPDRGGNIVVCRLCHNTRTGSSHLEMASRSIDSYAHAVHSFQAFDIGDVDFDNTVESMFYDLKVESHFPTFDLTDCQACHVAGKFNVPDQSKSLPGILSGADALTNKTRNIGEVPSYVTGPASRACGACHRAEWIKEDDAVSLASFNSHTKTNGYLLENGTGVLDNAISTIFSGVYFAPVVTP